jgi:ribosomal-protein-alanine N-acetyltransferase
VTPDRAAALNAPLTTDRLTLEPLVAAHADALFPSMQDDAIYTWISTEPPGNVGDLRKRFGRLESRIGLGGAVAWLNWAVRSVSSGDYVGRIDVEVDTANVATNVGYLFFPAFWGQGYASEAVNAVVEHLVREGVTELRATVTVGNEASARVLEKAGFVHTRILRGNDTIRGVACDDLEYVRREDRP